jgi:hypothetical protein
MSDWITVYQDGEPENRHTTMPLRKKCGATVVPIT